MFIISSKDFPTSHVIFPYVEVTEGTDHVNFLFATGSPVALSFSSPVPFSGGEVVCISLDYNDGTGGGDVDIQGGTDISVTSLSNVDIIYEKVDYYYEKNVQIDSNGYVLNYNPEQGIETVRLKFLVIKVNNEYTFTTIQYTNINEGTLYHRTTSDVFRPSNVEEQSIYQLISQVNYNLSVENKTAFDNKIDIGLYFYNNRYFYNFDEIDINSIIPFVDFKLYYYPVGTDTDLTMSRVRSRRTNELHENSQDAFIT